MLLNGDNGSGPAWDAHSGRDVLRAYDVISCDREQMPIYLFLAGTPARHLEHEARLARENRDEDWLVYADWLQQEGDPLGLSLMRSRTFGLGCARPNFLMRARVKVEWRYCFWLSAELAMHDGYVGRVDELQLLMAMVSLPQARLLRSLRVNLAYFLSDPAEVAALATQLIRVALPRTIRHLELGDVALEVTRSELSAHFPNWDGVPITSHSTHSHARYPGA